MPRNMFPGLGESELLPKRALVSAALDGGSQTHVAIAPGIFHEFSRMSEAQLRRRLEEYDYALYLIDPERYPNPYTTKVMKVKTVYC
jgi:hypothetical protein